VGTGGYLSDNTDCKHTYRLLLNCGLKGCFWKSYQFSVRLVQLMFLFKKQAELTHLTMTCTLLHVV